jgi:hypothetical protein
MDERFCKVDALGCAILGRHAAALESPMNLDLSPAFTRAQAVVNGLVAAIPGLIVALVVFGGFLLVAAIVRGVVARLTETRLHAHRNAGVAVAIRLSPAIMKAPSRTFRPARRSSAPAMAGASWSPTPSCSRIRSW